MPDIFTGKLEDHQQATPGRLSSVGKALQVPDLFQENHDVEACNRSSGKAGNEATRLLVPAIFASAAGDEDVELRGPIERKSHLVFEKSDHISQAGEEE